MSNDIRWRRLMAYSACMILPIALLYFGSQTWVALRVRQSILAQQITFKATSARQIAAIRGGLQRRGLNSHAPRLLASLELASGANMFDHNQQQLFYWLQIQSAPLGIDYPASSAVLEACFLPLRKESRGVIWPGAKWWGSRYPAPAELWRNVVEDEFVDDYLALNVLPLVLVLLSINCVAVMALPAALLLMPVSLRQSKVRYSHIVRVGMYSLFIPMIVIIACAATASAGLFVQGPHTIVVALLYRLAGLGFPMLLVWWWWAAIKHYLRVRHALVSALLLSAIAQLIGLGVVWAAASALVGGL